MDVEIKGRWVMAPGCYVARTPGDLCQTRFTCRIAKDCFMATRERPPIGVDVNTVLRVVRDGGGVKR